MTKPKKKILTTIFLMFLGIVGYAQDNGGGEGPPPPQGGPGPPGLPIDNGLIVLFVIALIYGIYILVKYTKKPTQV